MSCLNIQNCMNCKYYSEEFLSCAVNPKHSQENLGKHYTENTACHEFEDANPVKSLVMSIIRSFQSFYVDELTSEATFTSVGEKYNILGEHYNKGYLETTENGCSFWISWSLKPDKLKFTISCSE